MGAEKEKVVIELNGSRNERIGGRLYLAFFPNAYLTFSFAYIYPTTSLSHFITKQLAFKNVLDHRGFSSLLWRVCFLFFVRIRGTSFPQLNTLSSTQSPWLALSLPLRFSLLLSPTDSPTLSPGTPTVSLSFSQLYFKSRTCWLFLGGRDLFSSLLSPLLRKGESCCNGL